MGPHIIALLQGLGHNAGWLVLPQETQPPYIVVMRVGGSEEITLDGPTGALEGRVQIDCYAASFNEVFEMAEDVRVLLSGYRGGPITSARLQGTRDLTDTAGGDVSQRISLDFMVRWRA